MKKSLILVGMLAIGYANAQEGRVGINTQTPSATMNIKSRDDAKSPKNLELENQAGVKLVTVLNNGNVGIANINPSEKLEVEGNVLVNTGGFISRFSTNAGGWLELENPLKVNREVNKWRIYNMTNKEGSGGKYTNGLHFWAYAQNGSNLGSQMVITDTGNLGIGTTNPNTKLHINGKITITDGTQGVGKILMSDANGQASWQATTGRVTYGTFSREDSKQIPIYSDEHFNKAFYTGLSIVLEPGIYKITARTGYQLYNLRSWRYMSYVFDNPNTTKPIHSAIQFVGGEDYSNFNVTNNIFSRRYVPTADWVVDLSKKTANTTLYILQSDSHDKDAVAPYESDEYSITAVKID